ncbi:HalOD1 output domain-containing protein [Natrarchaeobaculum sulfurireducens]|uniref:Halobacterial output domain-containing protein n=1 Tax=Natrarchaeobaculum sulfurireducens TaxID=2044521 RepID=A0A346PIX4_9EURY|nr:HalOD1 output domain-containing protein [Natrarchaeobaculum sulfurireducens]AXR79469.1 hypothetical protein AArc1_3163 [Natrarchaeobaculum sulfurireducens]AXR83238.1 hypothetical protein AArcMg_3253 [Natrarchaeobaculum sulfurireducens]
MDDEPLELTIAREIAAREETDPIHLEPPLYEVVDVEALETLLGARELGSAGFEGRISFDYREYIVTVEHTGEVSVTAAAEAPSERPGTGRSSTAERSPIVTRAHTGDSSRPRAQRIDRPTTAHDSP